MNKIEEIVNKAFEQDGSFAEMDKEDIKTIIEAAKIMEDALKFYSEVDKYITPDGRPLLELLKPEELTASGVNLLFDKGMRARRALDRVEAG